MILFQKEKVNFGMMMETGRSGVSGKGENRPFRTMAYPLSVLPPLPRDKMLIGIPIQFAEKLIGLLGLKNRESF